ncbi:CheY-like chemotaxis protein [Sphingopyxis sp. OAS728]|uniref:response regulator n=1 Tax=Sphingopyxis sp. OAS728 TaxID=2663823 RepID=UPI00178A2752|nr:response regulator [Sphingopyxis sp. OAS728]MBE1529485.1 CheY-like chemotaxis protein [Sphingopyxis sp. OAS728]
MTDTPKSRACVVMVVEDEFLLLFTMADALESAGLTVIQASSAEEAVELLNDDRHIDILVTDIRLGGDISGWELAEIFRQSRPDCGVIYASANAPRADRQVPDSLFFAKPAPVADIVANCQRLHVEQSAGRG